jgi:hypothetical protein
MTQSKTHDPAAAPWRRLSLNTASSGTGTRGPRPGDPDDPTNDLASETSMKRGSASQLVSSARSWRWPEEPATGRSDHREHLTHGAAAPVRPRPGAILGGGVVTGHEMLAAGITISPLKWTVIHRDRPDRRDDRRVAGPLARPSACATVGCGQPHLVARDRGYAGSGSAIFDPLTSRLRWCCHIGKCPGRTPWSTIGCMPLEDPS